MFNSTHTFVGLLIAQTARKTWVRNATATAVIASNFPDVDSIAGFWGTATYLDHHRGITHAIVGVPVLALLVSAGMYFFSGNFGRTYVIALISMATHPLLDLMNPYGLRPFLPWSNRWYYGDVVFIIDPYLDAILLAGILWGAINPRRRRAAALFSFSLMAAYVATRVELHALALSKLREVAQVHGISNVAASPVMLNPLYWNGIAALDNRVVRTQFSAFGTPVLDLDSTPPIDPPVPSSIVARAAATESGAALLRFARFPVTHVEQTPSGYRVIMADSRTPVAAEVLLDRSANVINQSVSFGRF